MENFACPVCGGDTKECLHDRPDYEYAVPTRLSYHRCSNDHCGLVFANPIPISQVPSFYSVYSTHDQQLSGKVTFLSRHARRIFMREAADTIGGNFAAKILDYGCGSGQFLSELSDAGFKNLTGYDFDQKAREAARSSGAHVVDDEDELTAMGSFDVITMNHVIEHLVDPITSLSRLSCLLNPGGRIIIRTPNARSALSRVLGAAWRGWETPRHLHVFTPKSIDKIMLLPELAHRMTSRFGTSNAMFFGMFQESFRLLVWASGGGKIVRHLLAFSSFGILSLINYAHEGLGEELVVELRIE